VRDSLSNLAASLGAGKDKAASDGFVLYGLDRGQIGAIYRGDWLARKVVEDTSDARWSLRGAARLRLPERGRYGGSVR